jgi:methylmalonyl-CoA mutase
MKLENMKEISFPISNNNDWTKKVEESLRGKSIENLFKSTYENIQIKPLYTKEDLDPNGLAQYPGESNYSRGIESVGYKLKSWHIANKIPYKTLDQLIEKSRLAFSAGQNALAFEVKEEVFSDKDSLKKLLKEFSALGTMSIHTKEFFVPFMKVVLEQQSETGKMTGFIGSDPIAEAATKGCFNQGEEETFNQWLESIKNADSSVPDVKTILVDTALYQNSGANAVQEVGIALATGVFYVQRLLDNGWELEKALKKIVFHFAVGANFFMETAKLRAARILWDKAIEAYGADEGSRKMVISAETSQLTKTVFDPYVNLLRAGNEAFSAVLGGVQYLSVGTLDEAAGESSAFSERIARNTQLILKAEAHLESVADPAGGSYHVEALTKEIAKKAWEFFLEIDNRGGIVEELKANKLQKKIAEVRVQREKDVFMRKQSIIGTNVYANVAEKASFKGEIKTVASFTEFERLETKRLAEPYEILRDKAREIGEKSGAYPAVGLICLGEFKKHKARADFIQGFLSAGGIEASRSDELNDFKAVFEFIRLSNLNHFCICGDNSQYAEIGVTLVKEIKTKFPEVRISLAGKPDAAMSKEFSEAGIQQFYHLNSNNYEILANLLKEMEVALGAK